MSDKVSPVVSIAPVAAPGRIGVLGQPGSGTGGHQDASQNQAVKNPPISIPNATDVVSLQSLQAHDTLQTGPGKTPTQSVSQAQAQAQAALYAAKAVAQAKAQAEAKVQSEHQGSVNEAASALSSYFSNVHPDVNFRVEQQAGGEVVVMVNTTNGKVLQTISGDEARVLASSLFGKSASTGQKA